MATRTSRRRFTQRPSSANLDWSSFGFQQNSITGGGSKTLLTTFVSQLALELTIVRIRGICAVWSDQVAASEDQVGALGFIVVTDDAAAAGATAVPGPVTDKTADWFFMLNFIQRINVGTAVGIEPHFEHQYAVDGKAQRIIEPAETIAMVAESQAESDGFVISMQGRVLSRVRGTR